MLFYLRKLLSNFNKYTFLDLLLQKEFKGELTSRNHLLKALSATLSNSKDWEDHRKDRIK